MAARSGNRSRLDDGRPRSAAPTVDFHRSSCLSCANLTVPYFDDFPHPCRYNTLRLLGYDYTSVHRLCAITLVTDSRRCVFADVQLAKSVLACLLSDETLTYMRLRAFTLMPNHLHLLAGIREPEINLSNLIGNFKSYTNETVLEAQSRNCHFSNDHSTVYFY